MINAVRINMPARMPPTIPPISARVRPPEFGCGVATKVVVTVRVEGFGEAVDEEVGVVMG